MCTISAAAAARLDEWVAKGWHVELNYIPTSRRWMVLVYEMVAAIEAGCSHETVQAIASSGNAELSAAILNLSLSSMEVSYAVTPRSCQTG